MSLHSFNTWFTQVCMPSSEYIPDYKERHLISLKVKMQLIFFSLGICILTLQLFHRDTILFPHLLRITAGIILCFTLLKCCKSHLHIYYIILTFFCSFTTFIATLKGETIIPLIIGFPAAVLLFIITDTWYYYAFASLMHIINFNTFLRYQLEQTILKMDPAEFCERVMKVNSAHFIIMLAFMCPLHIALKKLTQGLRESKAEAENSLSHYKTFLFSFSHEVRNPINILLGSLEMALQERLPDSALQMVETAKISGELLLQLINNVLDVGKAEVGKLEIVPTPTRIHDLLIRMWNLCSELIKKNGLCGYLKINRVLPKTLELDPDRLNQVLMNLLSNAIKFTQKGLVSLTVEWLPGQEKVVDKSFEPLPFSQDDEGVFDKNESVTALGYNTGSKPGFVNESYILTHSQKKIRESLDYTLEDQPNKLRNKKGILKVIVKDQGCGMNQQAMKDLFKKFYQCNQDASQRKKGTGLGLYITKDICESVGGEIRAYSQEGRGTVFIACIPCNNLNRQE